MLRVIAGANVVEGSATHFITLAHFKVCERPGELGWSTVFDPGGRSLGAVFDNVASDWLATLRFWLRPGHIDRWALFDVEVKRCTWDI